jgi:hypothetical protein
MHMRIVLLVLLTSFVASCKSVDCGEGTTERDGICIAANETVGTASCGPFTVLQGDRCVPMLPPTVCDPASTEEDIDEMGVITCIGTGGGGCAARLACPTPADGRQTFCGQIYDFATGAPFAQAGAMGTRCTTPTASGPCSLGIRALDAAAFVMSQGAQGALATGDIYIDDCGRYRVIDVAQPAGVPLIALGVDDAATAAAGPSGTTNPVGVGTAAMANVVTRDLELFVVPGATLAGWAPNTTGGPPINTSQGIYAAVFRGHSTGTDTVAGVTINRNGTATDTRDYYFADIATRTMLNPAAGATSSNGGALFTIDPVTQMLTDFYSGSGGLPAGCVWPQRPGASVGGVILVQIFRPISAPGMTCSL